MTDICTYTLRTPYSQRCFGEKGIFYPICRLKVYPLGAKASDAVDSIIPFNTRCR